MIYVDFMEFIRFFKKCLYASEYIGCLTALIPRFFQY